MDRTDVGVFFFFNQKTAYEVRISDWSSDVCSSDLPVIGLMTEWQDEAVRKQQRDAGSDKGGTMRLGSQACRLKAGSKSRALYNAEIIRERHRHRYEFNNNYKQILSDHGMDLVAESAENELVEMVELPNHPFFVGCQFHPELTSTPRDGHPLFQGFVKAAREHHRANQPAQSAPAPAAARKSTRLNSSH